MFFKKIFDRLFLPVLRGFPFAVTLVYHTVSYKLLTKKTITRTFLSVRVMPLLKQTQNIWRKLLLFGSADYIEPCLC